MYYAYGDIWNSDASCFIVMTNGVVRERIISTHNDARGGTRHNCYYELVMGKGTAKQAVDKYPELSRRAGSYIHVNYKPHFIDVYEYGFFALPVEESESYIGLFQTKYHWRESSSMLLIEYSAKCLASFASDNTSMTFAMPVPGVGLGRLEVTPVLNILAKILPDNVYVYQYADGIETTPERYVIR